MKKQLGKMFLRLGERWALGYDAGESSRVRRDLGWGRSTPRDEDAPEDCRLRTALKFLLRGCNFRCLKIWPQDPKFDAGDGI